MSNSIVSSVYRFVIDDVVSQVRGDFEDMGIDDAILQELQRSWENKVAQSRVANFAVSEDSYYPEDADIEAAPGGAGSAPQFHGASPAETFSQAAAAASLATLASAGAAMQNAEAQNAVGKPQQFMPPRAVASVTPGNRNPNNIPTGPSMSLPTSGRTGIPQTDGAVDGDEEARPDMTTMELDALIARKILRRNDGEVEPPELDTSSLQLSATNSVGTPLSLESLPEEVQALVRDMRTRQRAAPRERKGKGKAKRIPQLDGDDDEEGEDDEDDINSDLDDSDEDDNDVEGSEEMDHIILCLYDKVTRTKNKWKCVLKDGIMLVNGRDYLFHRANGDFEW